jgi:hypothetical protein
MIRAKVLPWVGVGLCAGSVLTTMFVQDDGSVGLGFLFAAIIVLLCAKDDAAK